MSREEAYIKYYRVIQELSYLCKSQRAIARDCHTSLSTVVRIKKRFRL